jgi:hypothetical protein
MGKFKKWDHKDFLGLVYQLQNDWVWPSMVKYKWGKDSIHNRLVLFLEIHTGGHSENEELIDDLLENKMFCMLWYAKWERGGHYYFEINPYNVGWKTVKEYCKDAGISRQAVNKTKKKFDWIIEQGQPALCKKK